MTKQTLKESTRCDICGTENEPQARQCIVCDHQLGEYTPRWIPEGKRIWAISLAAMLLTVAGIILVVVYAFPQDRKVKARQTPATLPTQTERWVTTTQVPTTTGSPAAPEKTRIAIEQATTEVVQNMTEVVLMKQTATALDEEYATATSQIEQTRMIVATQAATTAQARQTVLVETTSTARAIQTTVAETTHATATAGARGTATVQAIHDATATSQAVQKQRALLDDGFSSNLSKWQIVEGSWSIERGALVGISSHESQDSRIVAGESSWTDYTIEGRFKMDAIDPQNAVVLFRVQLAKQGKDQGRYYLVANYIDYTNLGIILWRVDHGAAKVTSAPYTFHRDVWYEFRLQVQGDEVNYYINNQLVLSYQGLDYANGRIGLKVYIGKVRFDDIVVNRMP